jgi:hypothetical protein
VNANRGPMPAPPDSATATASAWTFWIAAVIGAGIMFYGVRGLLADQTGPALTSFGKWFIGADVLHDLVIAPVACTIGWALGRVLNPPWRFPIQAGLFASAVVFVIGWAPLRGYGRDTVPTNTTVDPLNYVSAIATVLAFVWIVVALWVAIARWRPRHTTLTSPTATDRNQSE